MKQFDVWVKDKFDHIGVDLEQFIKDEENKANEENVENIDSILGKRGRAIAFLLDQRAISYGQYVKEYKKFKDRNRYLYVYEMAPRTFGETWLEKRILEKNPGTDDRKLIKAKKKDVNQLIKGYLDPLGKSFSSQFDLLCIDGDNKYKVEVKACRATSPDQDSLDVFSDASLTSRAYSYEEALNAGFQFHFQQLKPAFCDIFILVGVCRDQILYWVLTPEELRKKGGLSTQHPRKGIDDPNDPQYEGQVFKLITDYDEFKVEENKLLDTIIQKMRDPQKA